MKIGVACDHARCYFDDSSARTVISYINVPFWTDPNINPIMGQEWVGYNTFQIVLNKIDSTITLNYKDRDAALTNNNDIEVGIQSKVGSFGLQHSTGTYFDMFSPNIGMPNALRFDPPSNPGSITDVAVNWNDNINNKGIFLSADGLPHTLKTNIKNEGNTSFAGATVIANLSPQFSPPAVSNNATLNTLSAGADTTFVLTNAFHPSSTVLGPHTFLTMLSGAAGDMDPTNNTLEQEMVVVDTTQSLINLSYAHTPGGGSINWSGGNGGIAVYLEPPFYPALIKNTNFYIENNTGASFDAKIYADDGLNGTAGTLLDSVTVPAAQVIAPGNNVVSCASPDTIFSGGVYVLWYMGAAGIGLGKDVTPPISGQTYEVLSNFWATYRDVENEDFFISIDIEKIPFSDDIGVSTIITPANNSTLGTSQNVEVSIENFGINTASNFDVNYQFNSGTTITETVTTTVAPGNTINHIFITPIPPMTPGSPSAQLCAWTSYSVDPNPINNQFCNMLNAPTTGVNEQALSKINIYPNPTTGKLYLENLPKESVLVEILDINGKTIYKTTKLIGKAIDISSLTSGIYQIKLEGKEWLWNQKLIKQ